MKIYERIYDNPKNKDGTKKPNKFLGNFKIVKTLFIDFYASKRIGIKDNKKYLIEEVEVSGFYHPNQGGSKFTITDINL